MLTLQFTAPTYDELMALVQGASREYTMNRVSITPTTTMTIPVREIAPAPEAEETETITANKPKRGRKPKAETKEEITSDDFMGDTAEPVSLTLDGDVIPGFQAYIKRVTEKQGREKALALAKNILAKFGVSSVRDLKPENFQAALDWLK